MRNLVWMSWMPSTHVKNAKEKNDYVYNPSARAEIPRVHWLANPIKSMSIRFRDSVDQLRKMSDFDLWPPHECTHVYTPTGYGHTPNTHTHIHTQIALTMYLMTLLFLTLIPGLAFFYFSIIEIKCHLSRKTR